MILINSSPKDALKIFQPFLPIYVPIGIGIIASVLDREQIPNLIIDEQIEEDVHAKIDQYISTIKPPYFFGFSVLTSALSSAVFLSNYLKNKYPDSVICFGGVHPTAAPDEILQFDHIDIVVRGEAEMLLPKLYERIKERNDFTDLSNISFKRQGEIIHNQRALVITDLDSLPLFPYHRFTSPRYDIGFIVSSRGCPYHCIFCSNRITTGNQYRFRSHEYILEELELLYHQYGKKFVLFQDDNMLVNKSRLYQLLEGIQLRGLHKKMTFSCQGRGDNVSYDLLKDMYSSGFRSIFFGLETASNRLMKVINKGENVEQCIEAVRIAKQIGFHVSATFIYGLPGETHQDRMDSLQLSKQLELDMVRYNNATPYPGTELFNIATQEKRIHIHHLYENFVSVGTFIENPFKPIPFSYVPPNNTEKGIRRDILFSYLVFYLDFKRLKRILSTKKEGVGWFSVGANLFDILKKIPALVLLGCQMFLKYVLFFGDVVKDHQLRYYQHLAISIQKKNSLMSTRYTNDRTKN
ncbi:MAG: B12-binding domain-containing radical SAM protein [Desulfobacterales bacterium]|nr:B12-binding domain-containing radical SAM protein [Desulfobacterales bacterium]